MAQEPNPLAPASSSTTGAYTARGKTPRQVERDIDETRSEMSETLGALSDRLDPSHLKDQAMDQAKDFLAGPASDVGNTLLDTVKQHPVPALAAALSIGWLVVKSGESEQDRRFEDDYYDRYGRYPAPGYAQYARRTGRRYAFYDAAYGNYDAGNSDRSLTDKAGDKLSDVKEAVTDKVADLTGQAEDRLHSAGDQARRQRRRASNWLEQQLDENPLLMGAAALAAGALVGLSVPETQAEDELMGEQSDRLVKQAKEVAGEKVEQAKKVARKTTAEAKSKARDVAKTAKTEAKKADLGKTPEKATSSSPSSGTTSALCETGTTKAGAAKAPKASGSSKTNSNKS